MRLIAVLLVAVLLVAVLAGCAHTPWGYNFTRNGDIPEAYRSDKEECVDKAWDQAKFENGSAVGAVFRYFYERNLFNCMRDKGYVPVGVHPETHKNPVRLGG